MIHRSPCRPSTDTGPNVRATSRPEKHISRQRKHTSLPEKHISPRLYRQSLRRLSLIGNPSLRPGDATCRLPCPLRRLTLPGHRRRGHSRAEACRRQRSQRRPAHSAHRNRDRTSGFSQPMRWSALRASSTACRLPRRGCAVPKASTSSTRLAYCWSSRRLHCGWRVFSFIAFS